jgi:hypothetical protein
VNPRSSAAKRILTLNISRTDIFGPEQVLGEQAGMKAASRYWVDLGNGVENRIPVLVTLANQIALRNETVTNATLWKDILAGYFQQRIASGWKPSPKDEVTLKDEEIVAIFRDKKHKAELATEGVSFEQAQIAVQDAAGYEKAKSLIASALSQANVDKFLKSVKSAGFKIREFEKILNAALLEKITGARQGEAATVYQKLPVSDQAQVRELYLVAVEQVASELRRKHQKVYEYA